VVVADTLDELEPGTVLAGQYRLDRRLGEGGMSVVWAATHVVTGMRVALKLMKHTSGALSHHARLLREARAARAVQHANVCQVLDVLELDDGAPVMVMEHLVGEPLSERLRRQGKLPLADFAAVFLPVVSALAAAHALGIVHRDLKPENIFLVEGPPPGVKVLDFGIAKLTAFEGAAAATAQLTDTGMVLGTPHYMSPEQALGEKDIDARADVWALGLLAYRCLSGVLPTDSGSLGQVFKSIVLKPLPPLEGAAPGLPADVVAVVGRMLVRTRSDRLSNLHEVTSVLGRYAPQIAAGSARA
jgi:serine/threonine-protein kinase